MASEVKNKLIAIIQDVKKVDASTAAEHFTHMVTDRFATDVFE